MKMAKRILICLLAMSLVVCAVAISVSASADGAGEQSSTSFSATTFDDILEYYENEDYMVGLFDDLAAGNKVDPSANAAYLWKSGQNIYVRSESDGDNYLEMSPQSGRQGLSSYINVAVDGSKAFVFEASVGATTNLTDFGVYICDTAPGSTDDVNNLSPAIKFDFANSVATVSYLSNGEYAVLGTVACDASSWINISIKFNEPVEKVIPGDGEAEDVVIHVASCVISVADFEDVVLEEIPVTSNVVVGLKKGSNVVSSKAKIDDLRVYEGSFKRDFENSLQTITENWIIDLKDYYDSIESVEDKLLVIGVVNKLTEDHVFVTENETVNDIITEFTVNSIKVYSDALAICNGKIAGMTEYTAKLECAMEYAQYKNRIPDNYVDILPDDIVESIQAVVTAYDDVVAGLEAAEDIALEFIDIVYGVNIGATEYDELKQICTDINSAIDVSVVDSTYPGAGDAMDVYVDLLQRRDAAITTLYTDMVESARVATYLPAKQVYLAASDKYYEEIQAVNLVNDKITAYRELYLEILASNAEREATAQEYIDACMAIEDAENETELQAAVAVAEQLRAALGELKDVESLEGMTTANKLLSNAQTSLKITSLRCGQYIALVAAIGDAKTLEDRFVAINAAIAVEPGTVDSFEGVPGAKAALDEAIAAYNAEVNSLNTAFENVTDVAADVSSSVNTAASKGVIANASAIIKKAAEIAAIPEEN